MSSLGEELLGYFMSFIVCISYQKWWWSLWEMQGDTARCLLACTLSSAFLDITQIFMFLFPTDTSQQW